MRPALIPLLALAACGQYPADTGGTLVGIERTGVVRIGLTQIDPADIAAARAYIARIERATGAKARVTGGSQEAQLGRLESGDLDLVIGEFADDSPWLADVALIEPLSRRARGGRVVGLAPVAANGENAWVGVLEKAVRDANEAPKESAR